MADKTPNLEVADSMMGALGYKRVEARTETLADELRAAAVRIRQAAKLAPGGTWTLHENLIDHGNTVESVILTDGRDGMDALVLSGEWYGEALAVMEFLVTVRGVAEPLASWLEQTAAKIDNETGEFVPECCDDTHERRGLVHVEPGCDGWLTAYRHHGPNGPTCRCFDHALAVARALNASTS